MPSNPNRRDFLRKSAVTTGAAGLIAAGGVEASGAAPAAKKRTILAIGAHYDDCVFGIPGILLAAVEKNYRVVILNIIGDYTNWAPIKGRAGELLATSTRLASERGMETRFLKYASMHFEVDAEAKQAVAEVVADVQPDVAFMLWRRDRHPDHEVASVLSEVALRQPSQILERPGVRGVSRIYAYDNGPGHTVGFEPNTFVNVTAQWPAAMEWLGRTMAFVHNRPYDPQSPDGAPSVKEKLAAYRGLSCGVEYAEALWATGAFPVEI
ncbi:MAG: PIG-L family deacetylase [Patescibacteria group bacterium]|nr:PIG-L family deacetylase [Patescibacteria group bacterium]